MALKYGVACGIICYVYLSLFKLRGTQSEWHRWLVYSTLFTTFGACIVCACTSARSIGFCVTFGFQEGRGGERGPAEASGSSLYNIEKINGKREYQETSAGTFFLSTPERGLDLVTNRQVFFFVAAEKALAPCLLVTKSSPPSGGGSEKALATKALRGAYNSRPSARQRKVDEDDVNGISKLKTNEMKGNVGEDNRKEEEVAILKMANSECDEQKSLAAAMETAVAHVLISGHGANYYEYRQQRRRQPRLVVLRLQASQPPPCHRGTVAFTWATQQRR